MKKISLFLASIAPGIFLIGYNIGTGSITTMAVAGASYGMSLVLPLLLSCIFTFFLIVVFGQYTAITGKTILQSFREHFGAGWALFVMISILLSEWMAIAGVMGVVVQVIEEWSKPLTSSGQGFSPILMAAFFAALLYALFWKGQHRFFERVLALFVALMGICFVLTMFMVIPEPTEIIRSLVPEIPRDTDKLLVMAGMAGTTMGAVLYVMRSVLVHEKGWTEVDLNLERRDALISAGLMFLLSMAIMASAAGTLYPEGLKIENAIDMVKLMEPLAGRLAISVFVAGIVCAGLSSLFPNMLLAPWLLSDYQSQPRDLQSRRSRILVLLAALMTLMVPLLGGRPVYIMLVSQAAVMIASPITLILMLFLINKEGVMGKHKASLRKNIFMGLVILFTLAMALAGVVGLIG